MHPAEVPLWVNKVSTPEQHQPGVCPKSRCPFLTERWIDEISGRPRSLLQTVAWLCRWLTAKASIVISLHIRRMSAEKSWLSNRAKAVSAREQCVLFGLLPQRNTRAGIGQHHHILHRSQGHSFDDEVATCKRSQRGNLILHP